MYATQNESANKVDVHHLTYAVVARGCLPPGQMTLLLPPPIKSVLQLGYFSGFQTLRVLSNFWGPLLFPPFLFHTLPSPLPSHPSILHPFPPLKVGPLNPARRSVEALSSPSGIPSRN